MPLTRVQSVTHEATGTTPTSNTTTITAPDVGALIVAAISGDKNIGADLAVPSGFTRIGSPYIGASVCRDFAWKISDGTETNIVWNYGGVGQTGDNTMMWVGVYTGNTASPFDVAAENDSANGNVSSLATGTTGTTAQTDEHAIAIGTIDSTGGGKTPSWNNSFVMIGTDFYGSNAGLSIAEKALASTGTQTSTVTLAAGSDQMAAAIATFKATATTVNPNWTGAGWW